MRAALVTCSLAMILSACGKKSEGISILPSARSADAPRALDAVAEHRCNSPAISGSPEQLACFEAAQAACPSGTEPKHVDFKLEERGQNAGQYVIRGYGCN